MKKNSVKQATPIKLKIKLLDVPVKIFRRILVPDNISMQDLHLVIQISSGWENRHLFEFSDRKSVRQTIRAVENKAQDDEWDFQPRAF